METEPDDDRGPSGRRRFGVSANRLADLDSTGIVQSALQFDGDHAITYINPGIAAQEIYEYSLRPLEQLLKSRDRTWPPHDQLRMLTLMVMVSEGLFVPPPAITEKTFRSIGLSHERRGNNLRFMQYKSRVGGFFRIAEQLPLELQYHLAAVYMYLNTTRKRDVRWKWTHIPDDVIEWGLSIREFLDRPNEMTVRNKSRR